MQTLFTFTRHGLSLALTLVAAMTGSAALAGDPAAGEAGFGQCKACHSITAPDGTDIVRGGKIGPNLYGVIGRAIASDPGFMEKYSPSLIAAGSTGAGWGESDVADYVFDPTGWLQEVTGDSEAKSKMSFSLESGGEDIAAFLAQFQ